MPWLIWNYFLRKNNSTFGIEFTKVKDYAVRCHRSMMAISVWTCNWKKVKADIAFYGNTISELRDVLCHMGLHIVTCYRTQVNAPRLTPAMQAGTRFTYPGGMEGWVDLVDLIVWMYYRSGTGVCCCIGQTLCVYPPGGNTFLREMTSWPPSWNCKVKSKIRLRQAMRIYVRNIPDEFHPDPIWNEEALGFFKDGRHNKKNKHNNNKMSSDMKSVPDLKINQIKL